MPKFDYNPINDQTPPSKTSMGWCKNEGCQNMRRERSAYCKECAEKYAKSKAEITTTKNDQDL